ncbi:MAG: hypothetical protein AB2689_05315 [Candidatus Thiodiazotropha taylori]
MNKTIRAGLVVSAIPMAAFSNASFAKHWSQLGGAGSSSTPSQRSIYTP